MATGASELDSVLASVAEARRGIDEGSSTRSDLVDRAIAAAEENISLNIFTSLETGSAHREAAAADLRAEEGSRGPLDGVPYAVKDIIDVAGTAVSAGTAGLRHDVVPSDAPAITLLRRAGAQLIGKTNMHELSLGITSNNLEFGPVRNPYATDRIAGGSSGGSGAAVAAGVVPFAIAGDTGGSSRIPAALCGVVGYRPTVGRYPSGGLVPISSTRDTLGVIARTVDDVCRVDAVLSGGDHDTSSSPGALRGVGLGRPAGMNPEEFDSAVWQAYGSVLDILRRNGARIVDVDVMHLVDGTMDSGTTIALRELPLAFATYMRASHPSLSVTDIGSAVRSPDVKKMWKIALSGAVRTDDYARAIATMTQARSEYRRIFESSSISALVFPTTPVTARPIGEEDTITVGKRTMPTFETYTRFTSLASIIGSPAISLPAGHDGLGLPIGVELDGIPSRDAELLRIAELVERTLKES